MLPTLRVLLCASVRRPLFPLRSPAFTRYVSTATAMPAIPTPWKTNNYPSARRSDHVDVYKSETKGEVRVHDPYQWLEGNTEETEQWTTAQEAYTREFLDKNPERQVLEDEIRRNTDYAKVGVAILVLTLWVLKILQFSAPSFKEDGRWYWYYNSGLQAQSGMCPLFCRELCRRC